MYLYIQDTYSTQGGTQPAVWTSVIYPPNKTRLYFYTFLYLDILLCRFTYMYMCVGSLAWFYL